MRRSGGVADAPFGPRLGERAVRDDRRCDRVGPPPRFRVPPPPRPPSLVDADCTDSSIREAETCGVVPVIDAEYHSGPAIPSLAVILIVAVAVGAFLLVGTILVVLKKKKMQHFLPRKSSPQNRCDSATANGIIYEDLTDVRPRALPRVVCSPGQTALPSVEMIDVDSFADRSSFSPAFVCPSSPVLDSYDSQDLFNPVYEELSNGSGERGGETDSEGLPRAPVSEDEFAEDELSLGGDADDRRDLEKKSADGSSRGSGADDVCRDADFSDADDGSRFLGRNSDSSSGRRDEGRKSFGSSRFRRGPGDGGSKTSDGRKIRRNETPSSPSSGRPPDGNEFHEGLLLETLLRFYPNATGSPGPRARRSSRPEDSPGAENRFETVAAFGRTQTHHPRQEIFTTFRSGPVSSGKIQSRDSSFGSDSGYSNNTSGGRSSSRGRKDYRISDRGDLALS